MKTNPTILFNAYNKNYEGGTNVSQTPSTNNTFAHPGSSWKSIISYTGFGFGSSSSSASTSNELENNLETKFAAYIFNDQGGNHGFNKFDLLSFWRS